MDSANSDRPFTPSSNGTILLTRTENQSRSLQQKLEESGFTVLNQPVIEILPVDDYSEIDSFLSRLNEFDWLIFSSSNGVRFFLDRFFAPEQKTGHEKQKSWARLRQNGLKIAAMGPGTAGTVSEYGLPVDLIPDRFCAEGMAAALTEEAHRHKRFLSLRASRGRQVLSRQLSASGGVFSELVVYQSRDVTVPDQSIRQKMETGRIDAVTVTSSAGAKSLIAMFGDSLKKTRLVAISSLTGDTIREAGFPVLLADEASEEGLVARLQKLFRQGI